jgi:hypothetical protein
MIFLIRKLSNLRSSKVQPKAITFPCTISTERINNNLISKIDRFYGVFNVINLIIGRIMTESVLIISFKKNKINKFALPLQHYAEEYFSNYKHIQFDRMA